MEDDAQVPRVPRGVSKAVGRPSALQENRVLRGSGEHRPRGSSHQRYFHAPEEKDTTNSAIEEKVPSPISALPSIG